MGNLKEEAKKTGKKLKSDVEIAQQAIMLPITEIAGKLGIEPDEIEQYGKYKAKISPDILERLQKKENAKLILVTAINPTPAGEGKTTTNVGLSMALNTIGKNAVCVLREPSLGPCFGIKGGAAGGGYAQVLPMEDINLHFTGDFHAVTSAHNLLAALLDNHIHQGNTLKIDPKRVEWRRTMDMNERSLRNIVIGMGGKGDGFVRQSGFDITAASEIMAILCLSSSLSDLKTKVSRILVAYDMDGNPVTAGDLNAQGAMALLLKDAIKPNLVQTLENTPAIIHGGPFGNIAHGCNSIIATSIGMKIADYCVTEAGFGADLGAEKFFDIKCRYAGIKPNVVVMVATVRALKFNGGAQKDKLGEEDLDALDKGFSNLDRHLDNIKKYKLPTVVAINRFPTDSDAEMALLKKKCETKGIEAIVSDVFANGGDGAVDLAKSVVALCEENNSGFKPLYDLNMKIEDKVGMIAREIYGADGVDFSAEAKKKIAVIERIGLDMLPICVAKTQYSFSDDASLLGAPKGYNINVRDIKVSSGAGYIVAYTGEIMTMPGLPKVPAANNIDISDDGCITGLF